MGNESTKKKHCCVQFCKATSGVKSSTLNVGTALQQGCAPRHLLCFGIFMPRTSKCCRGLESVQLDDIKMASLLFADDVVLLALSPPICTAVVYGLQHPLQV